MNETRSTGNSGGKAKGSREDRLLAALRANLAKRKAQARARTEAQTETGNNQAEPVEQETGKPEGDE